MSIKPVLVPDHDAVSLRRLMDHFAEASTGPTRRQLTESRSAVAAARKTFAESSDDSDAYDKWDPKHPDFVKNYKKFQAKNPGATLKDYIADLKKSVSESSGAQVDMKGKKCTTCKKGTYQETGIQDNMHGELHCTKCNTVVKSRQPAAAKKKRVAEGSMYGDEEVSWEKGGRRAPTGAFRNPAVVKTNKSIGTRVSDIGPGGKEFNVKTDKEWDKQKGVAEAAKWRTHPDAHDHDTDGSLVPKGGIKSDSLATRQGVSRTQSEKDPKSLAGKFGDKYAKKHGVPTKQLMKNIPLDDIEESGVAEGFGRDDDDYHLLDVGPTRWYRFNDGRFFTFNVYPGEEKQAERDGYSRTQAEARQKSDQGTDEPGVAEGREQQVDELSPQTLGSYIKKNRGDSAKYDQAGMVARHEKGDTTLANKMFQKADNRYHGEKRATQKIISQLTKEEGVAEGEGMSRAAKGYEKYGRAGMAALAKAGREGRALDPVRDRYDRYDEAVAEGHAGKELKAIDGDYYEDSTDFFSMFEQDHFDREEESEDGMEIRGYIDDVCVMVFKYSTPDMMGGWGNYDDSALVAEGHDHGPDHTHSHDHDHEEEHDEVCPECDGAGCPECYGEEDRDRAYDHAQGLREAKKRNVIKLHDRLVDLYDIGFDGNEYGKPYVSSARYDNGQRLHTGELSDLNDLYPNFYSEMEQGLTPTMSGTVQQVVLKRKTRESADGAASVKYGVFAKGGSVGSQRFRDDPLKTFDTREEAVADARRRRSGLSKGERGYYRMGYVVKPIKGSAEQVDEKSEAGRHGNKNRSIYHVDESVDPVEQLRADIKRFLQ